MTKQLTPIREAGHLHNAAKRGYICMCDRCMNRSEHVIIQTGGSWGSAAGYYIGSEYAKPEPFTGWQAAQS